MPQLGPEQWPRSRGPPLAAAPAFTSGCQHSVSRGGEALLRLPPLNSRRSPPPPPLHLAGEERRRRGRARCRWARVDVCADPVSAWHCPARASDGAWTLLLAPGIGAAGLSPLFAGGALKAVLENRGDGGGGGGCGWCPRELQTHTPLPGCPSPPFPLPFPFFHPGPLAPLLLCLLLCLLSPFGDASLYRVAGLALQWQLMEWGKARQQGWGLRTAGGRAAAAA